MTPLSRVASVLSATGSRARGARIARSAWLVTIASCPRLTNQVDKVRGTFPLTVPFAPILSEHHFDKTPELHNIGQNSTLVEGITSLRVFLVSKS